MMTRISKPAVSETDVSPKKMNIQEKPHRYLAKPEDKIARSYKGGRYAMPTLCRLFISDGWRYCRGSIPSKSSAVMNIYMYIGLRMPHSKAASERTFSMGNNIGKVLSDYIAMNTVFLNSISRPL